MDLGWQNMLDKKTSLIPPQLGLHFTLGDEATFDTFQWGSNALLHQQFIEKMPQGTQERFFYIWGAAGNGKTHLLQACCQALPAPQTAVYLPLALLQSYGPDILEGVSEQDFIAIDDLEAIAKNPAWEEAVFHLINRIRDENRATLILSSQYAPALSPLSLPDLRSRLHLGLVIELQALDDTLKIKTLQDYAARRGFALPTPVATFLIQRCDRNMHTLYNLLNTLDSASLAAQRKVTIPFVKQVLRL